MKRQGAKDLAQQDKYLLDKHKDLSSIPVTKRKKNEET